MKKKPMTKPRTVYDLLRTPESEATRIDRKHLDDVAYSIGKPIKAWGRDEWELAARMLASAVRITEDAYLRAVVHGRERAKLAQDVALIAQRQAQTARARELAPIAKHHQALERQRAVERVAIPYFREEPTRLQLPIKTICAQLAKRATLPYAESMLQTVVSKIRKKFRTQPEL
jgi:hypothetical protein